MSDVSSMIMGMGIGGIYQHGFKKATTLGIRSIKWD